MKRFIALVLSLVMTLSLCTPAWGAGGTLSGTGTAADPFIINDADDLLTISEKYDTYAYYKVADGVTTLDMTGIGNINLNGSFDGNGVTMNNLTTALFKNVGKSGVKQDIKISNLTANVHTTDGRALVRNIFNPGETIFENVTMHGYIEGQYNMGSFYNYGTANAGDSEGADYTVSFVNAKSDVTLVCTTGNVMGGMLGHGYEGANYKLSINMDANSGYTGKMSTVGGKTCYQVMAMCSHSTYILNGVETSRYENTYPSTALTIAAPEKAVDGYYVKPADGVARYVVFINAQVTAYDDNGEMIANLAGMTWPLGNVTITDTDGKVFDLIESAEIVNGVEHDFGYAMNNGVLTIYSGRSENYLSGVVTLQVNQYAADGALLATGIVPVYTFEDPTFYTVSFDANGGSGEMNALKKANGVDFNLPECAFNAPAGKYFKGWATTKDATEVLDTVYTVTGEITLYAIWEDITYNVAFNANGGTGTMAGETVVIGTAYELPGCGFSIHEGKKFKGWATAKDGAVITDKTYTVNADVTFYAIWEEVPVVEEKPPVVEIETAAPTVDVTVDTTEKNETEMEVVEKLTNNDDAVTFDDAALKEHASEVAKDNDVTQLEGAVALESVAPVDKIEDVAIVVQPYYDVEVKDVEVVKDAETGEVASASIELNITPMYQTVATTQAVVNDPHTEIKVGTNAAVVGEAKKLEVTEPVTITVAIPKALAVSDGANGYKSLFVTHTKDNGTKYVYEAKVEGNDVDGYTATFLNPNGFSSFTLSTVDSTAVTMNGMNYVDLQSAINDLGKGATIKVLSGNHTAVVSGSTSFKVVLENGATANITAANGYRVIKYLINGVYMYNVVEASAGGYYPSYPGTSSKPTTSKPIQSADTFDAGIALYVGMSVMAAAGSAVVIGKKRED